MALQEKTRFARFMAGKGFYIALALLVVGAGATAWIAIDQTVGEIEGQSPSSIAEQNDPHPFTEAGQPAVDVPRESSAAPDTEDSPDSALSPDAEPSDSAGQSVQWSVSYAFPLDGNILNPYSGGELVKSVTLGDWRTHDGIDIAADAASPVAAVAQGVVAEVVDDPMFGMTIRIEHPNGVTSIYQSLNETVAVEVGQSVAQGDVIGSVGETALAELSLPSHLHFAMTRDGAFIDPLEEMDIYAGDDFDE